MQTKTPKPPSIDMLLITPKFRWIPEEFWEDRHVAFVQAGAARLRLSIHRAPRLSRRRGAARLSLWRWVLTSAEGGEPLAWASLHLTEDKVGQALIAPHFPADAMKRAPEFFREALSLLVSACVLQTRCDLLRLVQANPLADGSDMTQDWGGGAKTLWAMPPMDAWLTAPGTPAALEAVRVSEFSPHAWWATPNGTQDYAQLGYLRKRMERHEEDAKACRPAPRKRGLLSRLLYWS